jgi:chemotaxis response regulator CheB
MAVARAVASEGVHESAVTGSRLMGGPGVTVVPPGRAASVDSSRTVTLIDIDPQHGGDVLLTSLAPVFRSAAIAVVLTGMLDDGARGVRAVKRHGGRVLVQEPADARAAGMPSAALATGCVDFALPLDRIASGLITLVMAPRRRRGVHRPHPGMGPAPGLTPSTRRAGHRQDDIHARGLTIAA